jgi:hypothetical protein
VPPQRHQPRSTLTGGGNTKVRAILQCARVDALNLNMCARVATEDV